MIPPLATYKPPPPASELLPAIVLLDTIAAPPFKYSPPPPVPLDIEPLSVAALPLIVQLSILSVEEMSSAYMPAP